MTYLLDKNIFIDAKNRYYGFDICPAFWEWLTKLNKSEIVFSIEKVGDELKIIDDQLSTWAAKHGSNFFLSPDSSIQPAMDRVSNWAINRIKANVVLFIWFFLPLLRGISEFFGFFLLILCRSTS